MANSHQAKMQKHPAQLVRSIRSPRHLSFDLTSLHLLHETCISSGVLGMFNLAFFKRSSRRTRSRAWSVQSPTSLSRPISTTHRAPPPFNPHGLDLIQSNKPIPGGPNRQSHRSTQRWPCTKKPIQPQPPSLSIRLDSTDLPASARTDSIPHLIPHRSRAVRIEFIWKWSYPSVFKSGCRRINRLEGRTSSGSRRWQNCSFSSRVFEKGIEDGKTPDRLVRLVMREMNGMGGGERG